MMCPDCRRLRHEGPCEPVYEDEPDDLEMAQAFHELEGERLERAARRLGKKEAQNGNEVGRA